MLRRFTPRNDGKAAAGAPHFRRQAVSFGVHAMPGVDAHSDDLAAAKACGLQTGFVARPNEKGPGKGESKPKIAVDFAGDDMVDLAQKIFG